MAVKTPPLLLIITMVLSAALLLSGCGGKDQTVSDPTKRSDLSDAGGSSVSVSDAVNAGENQGVKADKSQSAAGAGQENAAVPGNGALDENKDNQAGTDDTSQPGPAARPAPESTEDAGNNSPAASGAPVEIKFSEMYAGSSARGLKFSDKLAGLSGKKVVMTGYMAPPLKPSLTFFVLTREPMALCPFCSTDASWPEDIVLTFLPKNKDMMPTESVIRVTGTLELGSKTEADTGFVSQVRIYADRIEAIR